MLFNCLVTITGKEFSCIFVKIPVFLSLCQVKLIFVEVDCCYSVVVEMCDQRVVVTAARVQIRHCFVEGKTLYIVNCSYTLDLVEIKSEVRLLGTISYCCFNLLLKSMRSVTNL